MKKLFILSIFINLSLIVFAQENIRRHFIIAYDISTPFKNAERQSPVFKQALIDLFSNNSIYGFTEANQDNLRTEKNNNVIFFDKEQDDISFFHFNVARGEFGNLRMVAQNYGENRIVESFTESFIKDKVFNWNTFKSENNYAAPSNYITTAFAIQSDPINFDGGVSMSNFVYPLILDRLETTTYAEEYVLILLSDFLTGSMLGNNRDLDRVRDIYSVPYNTTLPSNSPVTYIKKRIDYLASQYNKMDYFQYSFLSNHNNNKIAIIAFKIKPKIGVLTPENVALFVNSNLDLYQKSYQSTQFKTSEVKIKFTHNKNLAPVELQMTIALPLEDGDEQVIFNDVIAAKNEAGSWISNYTSDNNLMNFDEDALTYHIPKLNIELDSIVNEQNFENLIVRYQFKTKYEAPDLHSVGFLYKTERLLSIGDINFKTETSIIIMNYVLLPLGILLLIICIIVILVNRGKPQELRFTIKRPEDSFEKTDFNKDGKLITDYKKWYDKQKEDLLPVNGVVEFKADKYPFNWKSKIKLQLNVECLPQGFGLFLKENADDIAEYDKDNVMIIRPTKTGKFSFWIGIRQTDINKKIDEPELVKFSVKAVLQDSFAFIKADIRKNSFENTFGSYLFHIGQNLRDVCVAFDPGTTGSCIAIGSEAENIRLSKKIIVPSVITFDKTQNYDGLNIPKHEYGTIADQHRYGTEGYAGFKSIKKMLGFKDSKEIVFSNNTKLSLKGKDLASLLVESLYKDLKTDFDSSAYKDDYIRNNEFKPLRAVVAIPNNFTAAKIQDMIECVANLKLFKEIRYVYEAEAVLFHYISTHKVENSETILVFDMGGATINATVVAVNKIKYASGHKYDIDILGKIGYGIGGDTIDYCILKFLMDFPREFGELHRNLSNSLGELDKNNNKEKLCTLAFEIKKEIIHNYNKRYTSLIQPDKLTRLIKERFPDISTSALKFVWDEMKTVTNSEGHPVQIEEQKYSKLFEFFVFVKKNNSYPLFEHKIFQEIIYNNVKDAVKEVIELANVSVDKIVFAGRSIAFPLIKDIVEKQAGKKGSNIGIDFTDLKTAVAKGACWYGIHRNAVQLHNLKTTAAFGYKETMSPNRTDVKFHPLIAMGKNFNTNNNGISFFRETKKLEVPASFNLDAQKVNFYQIMGKNAKAILQDQDQKHKYSKIATIEIDYLVTEIAMQVNENDNIDCFVRLETTRVISEKGVVADQEINEANAEHYTWII